MSHSGLVVDRSQGILGLCDGILGWLNQFRIAVAGAFVKDLRQFTKTIGIVAHVSPIDEAGDL
ncbi:MAG: hypothetical protein KGJ25_11025, partial [Betaproteobacteria bacterium]|nr:hypothetical protein [Betaproteobacteria bacterium]